MPIDPGLVVALGIVAIVLLWAVAIVLGRVDGRVTARGLRNGLMIATALFVVTLAVVTFVFNGRPVFLATLDLGGAFQLGVLVGLVVALGYLWLGALLIAIGLIFRSRPQWTTLGAWAAVPVVVMSLGLGYVSYRSVAAEGAPSTDANGLLSMTLTGSATGRVTADGVATCSQNPDTNSVVVAGTPNEPRIVTSDGRLVFIQISTAPDSGTPTLDRLTIADQDLTPDSVSATGDPSAGRLSLQSSGWSGTITWSCSP